MKRSAVTKMINRISRRESLPLLRGMFVCPEQVKRKKDIHPWELFPNDQGQEVTSGAMDRVNRLMQRAANFSHSEEDGLYITADEGLYLGR